MSETMVERVAQAMVEDSGYPWGDLDDDEREIWRHQALAALKAQSLPEFDGPLNKAGWAMINALQELGPVNGAQFNNMKACLRLAFLAYFDAAIHEAEKAK